MKKLAECNNCDRKDCFIGKDKFPVYVWSYEWSYPGRIKPDDKFPVYVWFCPGRIKPDDTFKLAECISKPISLQVPQCKRIPY